MLSDFLSKEETDFSKGQLFWRKGLAYFDHQRILLIAEDTQ